MSNNKTLTITIPDGINNVVIKYDNDVKPEINLVVKSQRKTDHKYTTLAGKQYLVQDNSFISEVFPYGRKDSSRHYDLYGKNYLIVSDPYETSVKLCARDYIRRTMIKVMDDTNRVYEVMYNPGWVVD